MMHVVAHASCAPPKELEHEGAVFLTTEFMGSMDEPGAPEVTLAEYSGPPTVAHFHHIRQFLVILGGSGRIGKRDAVPVSFLYTDPSSPYGPVAPSKDGLTMLSLRSAPTRNSYWMPGSRDKMRSHAGRNILVTVPDEAAASGALSTLIDPHDDGLASYLVKLGAGEAFTGPAPEGSGGQFYVVTEGSVECDGVELKPYSIIWVDAKDEAPALLAGGEGVALLILQLPIRRPELEPTDAEADAAEAAREAALA